MSRKIYISTKHGFSSRISNTPPVDPNQKYGSLSTRHNYAWKTDKPTVGETESLFSDGQIGAWWDPYDLSTLFQDAAGTIPVTKNSDPVGRIKDKSGNGHDLIQDDTNARPVFETDGSKRWVKFDGATQFLKINAPMEAFAEGIDQCLAYDTMGDTDGVFFTTVPDAGHGYIWSTDTNKFGMSVFPFAPLGVWVDGAAKIDKGSVLASDIYAAVNGRHAIRTRYVLPGRYPINFQFGNSGVAEQWLSGRLYGMIVRSHLTDDEIPIADQWTASRAGVTLLA